MDLDISNKAMSPMSQFGIQFNKNSFGLTAAAPLQVYRFISRKKHLLKDYLHSLFFEKKCKIYFMNPKKSCHFATKPER